MKDNLEEIHNIFDGVVASFRLSNYKRTLEGEVLKRLMTRYFIENVIGDIDGTRLDEEPASSRASAQTYLTCCLSS
jgi:hypothetical protein